MAFQLGDDDSQSMSEMNLIPLIDIMLVLMIINVGFAWLVSRPLMVDGKKI